MNEIYNHSTYEPMSRTCFNIINARLLGSEDLHIIRISDRGIIETIIDIDNPIEKSNNEKVLNVNGDLITLGGVDLQINGGLGLAFPELEQEHFSLLTALCDYLWQHGVDAFLPTIVTTSVENIQRSLSVIAEYMESQKYEKQPKAKILGVHLEGPFLNSEKRGAHPAEYLIKPTTETVEWVLGDYAHIVKIITLAPELDITEEVIPYLRSQGIVVSLGHSSASVEEAKKAFKLGASMVTHAFNAMPPLHHRKPGLLAEAITNQNVCCGLIADGQHVSPTMIDLLLRASNYEQGIFLVSDALSPIGLPDGIYPWDERQIEVSEGTARLADGTLAGTTLPLLVGVENLVKWGVCDVNSAIALATESPRKAMGMPGMGEGQPANLLRWHWEREKSQLTWQRLAL
jgi:N-acetylglucosamine-6-phosphate deacetylase